MVAKYEKAVWGPRFWYVLETVADRYPDQPTPEDKQRFSSTVKGVTAYVPCDDCLTHGNQYLADNPPEPENREQALHYICNFRNNANEHAGNPTVNCDQVIKARLADSTEACDTCSVAGDEKETANLTRGQKAIIRSKESERDLFNSYCDADGIERPPIVHAPCPTLPDTSCVDPKANTIYLNPYTSSDRQILHEYQHYRDLKKQNTVSTEDQANDFAYDELNTVAPKLVPLGYTPPSQADLSMIGDTPTATAKYAWSTLEKADLKRMGIEKAESSITDGHKAINKEIADIDRLAGRRKGKKMVSIEDEFPMYAMMMEEERKKKAEEEARKNNSRGALSILDPIYESYARAMGFVDVQPHLLNLAYTPQVVENVIMTLAEANMTSAGAGFLSLGLGITFFTAGLLGRKKLVPNDQLLLQNLCGSFFWRSLEFLNPKRKMKESVEKVIDEFKDGHYNPKIFFETPEHALKASAKQAATPQQLPPGVPGSVQVDAAGNPIPPGTAIGTTDTMTDAAYDLDGDNYYDDTDQYEIDRGQGYIDPMARNIYTAQPDPNAADPGDLEVAQYATEDDEDDYDMYD